MTWVRLDDQIDEHPKIAQVGPLGMAMFVAGLAYCNRNETDGRIPWSAARSLLHYEFLGSKDHTGQRKRYKIAYVSGPVGDDATAEFVIDLLLDAGLWEEIDGGYMIHDFADYQPTKAHIESERSKKQAAGQAGGLARAKQTSSNRSSTTQAKSKPVPDPDPVRSSRSTASSRSRGSAAAPVPRDAADAGFALAFSAVENLTGAAGPTIVEKINGELESGTAPEWIAEACSEAAIHNGRSWAYVSKILENWKRNGFKADRKGAANGRRDSGANLNPYANHKPVIRPAELRGDDGDDLPAAAAMGRVGREAGSTEQQNMGAGTPARPGDLSGAGRDG